MRIKTKVVRVGEGDWNKEEVVGTYTIVTRIRTKIIETSTKVIKEERKSLR